MKNLFYVFLFSSMLGLGQSNLVPNPGFETYTWCPNGLSLISRAIPWFQPTGGTSDFFNACAYVGSYVNIPKTISGDCYARDGNGMAGVLTVGSPYNSNYKNYREYIAVKLVQQLISNQKYYVSAYVKLGDSCVFASSSFGIFFSKDSISKTGDDTIGVSPQVINSAQNFITSKTTWTQIKGSFTATGTEKYFYFGNFSPALNDTLRVVPGALPQNTMSLTRMPYYFIDDICVSTDENRCDLWTGLDGMSYNNLIIIYPNPVKDKFILEVENTERTKGF